MKTLRSVILLPIIIVSISCSNDPNKVSYDDPDTRIILLHHSTGNNVWRGKAKNQKSFSLKKTMSTVPQIIKDYNNENGTKIAIEEQNFPSGAPYPWDNYPYDYYNIWVKNAGPEPYMEEPTLEILSQQYDVIIFKHCFPVSRVLPDDNNPDIDSPKKTAANYKLQYEALKQKLLSFPNTLFVVWTGAALLESQTSVEEAQRAKDFFDWVKNTWDAPDDNITIFDFRDIETEGGLYLLPEYSVKKGDPHPNIVISEKAAKLLTDEIINLLYP